MKNNRIQLRSDAKNRSLRTFVQGLAIDILVGAAVVLATLVGGWSSWGEVQWASLSFSLAKSVAQAVAAYIMRFWLDASKLPTPLPPTDG